MINISNQKIKISNQKISPSKFLSLKFCYEASNKLYIFALMVSLFLLCVGILQGFFLTPKDYLQGEGFRIIYVHVPSAFWSLAIYSFIFVNSVIYLVWRIKIADCLASSSAPIGASYTLIALITGALWGKPMWGTYWVWDARLTSELILLFLYMGYLALRSALPDLKVRAKIAAILAIVGMVDIPIVHFSVQWWNTLHQGATLARLAKPSMSNEMLFPLLVLIAGFGVFYVAVLMRMMRKEILEYSKETVWWFRKN